MTEYVNWEEFIEMVKAEGEVYEDDIPTISIVRCKDCKWYEIAELTATGKDDKRYKPSLCVLWNRTKDEDWFCADGREKEE